MYKDRIILIVDTYDLSYDIIGKTTSYEKAKKIAREYDEETDGECCIHFFRIGDELDIKY